MNRWVSHAKGFEIIIVMIIIILKLLLKKIIVIIMILMEKKKKKKSFCIFRRNTPFSGTEIFNSSQPLAAGNYV
jgi:hypothetical protein